MNPLGGPHPSDSTQLSVLLDGRLIGEVEADKAKELATKLRTLKTLGQEKVGEIYMHVNFHLKNILPYSLSALMGTMFIMIFFAVLMICIESVVTFTTWAKSYSSI